MNIFNIVKKTRKSSEPDLEATFSDKLREVTISKLYRKNFEEPSVVPPLTSEQLWKHRNCGSRQMLSDLQDAVSKAAELGYPELQVEIVVYKDADPIPLSSGLEISDYDLTSKGKVDLEIWPFSYKDAAGTKRNSFEKIGSADDFKHFTIRRLYDHFKQKGLSVREVDLYDEYYRPIQYAQPYSQTCPEYNEPDWNTVLSIRWMNDKEYRQAQAAMSICGGYDAYKHGVPLEDIIA